MARTYKGKDIDLGALMMMNQHSVALGNAHMNARGDKLGSGGTVIKTREQLDEEYWQKQNQIPAVTDETIAVPEVQEEPAEVDAITPKRRAK